MWQGIVIDAVLVIILALAAYQGYKNGAIKVILGFVIMLIIIPIVYATYKPITNIVIKKTSFHETIKTSVSDILENQNIDKVEKLENTEESTSFLTKKINEFITNAKEEHYSNLVEKVSEDVATFIIQMVVILCWSMILFAILTIIKLIIIKIVDAIPLINILNFAAGSVLQLVKVLAIVFAILYVLQLVLPLIQTTAILENIEKTNIIKYMYNNNIINKFYK